MQHFVLDQTETDRIEQVLGEITELYPSVECAEFVSNCNLFAHELPRRLRQQLNTFRLDEPSHGLLLISGLPVDDQAIGPTPRSLRPPAGKSATMREEAFLILVMTLLGDVIGWSTQQSGRLIHNICPLPEHQDMQLGTGCKQLLTWHTEDAFHPQRGDYLGMLCLRNSNRTATTIASVADLELDSHTRAELFRTRFIILPDHSHRGTTDIDSPAENARIEGMLAQPERIAVLFGAPDDPYVRIDPFFMPMPVHASSRDALQTIISQFDNRLTDLVLSPGEICIMDNYRVVHGRRPFRAKYDGTDRWLKRAVSTRDLRHSKSQRTSARVIG